MVCDGPVSVNMRFRGGLGARIPVTFQKFWPGGLEILNGALVALASPKPAPSPLTVLMISERL